MSVTHVDSVSQLNGILADSSKLTVSDNSGLLSREAVVNSSHIGHRLPCYLVIRLAYLRRLAVRCRQLEGVVLVMPLHQRLQHWRSSIVM